MDPSQYEDLKAVYLYTFAAFATDPSEVAANVKQVGNHRYARELLAILEDLHLVAIQDVNGEYDVHQVVNPGTYDTHTTEEAEATFAEVMQHHNPNKESVMAKSTKPASNPADLPLCKCGCGTPVGRKSNYKPGHDARHAGNVARKIALTSDPKEAGRLLDTLPTQALQMKAAAMADRLTTKADTQVAAKAAKASKTDKDMVSLTSLLPAVNATYNAEKAKRSATPTEDALTGTVKIGRWQYPAKAHRGEIVRNQARDGSSDEWLPVNDAQAKTFVADQA